MAGKGAHLEKQIKIFFGRIFEECGFVVLKSRRQKSGTQDGFDIEFIIIDEYYRRFNIYIECKDYSSKINYADIINKIPQVISSYNPDLFIFISPKVSFGNPYNDTRLKNFYDYFETPIEFLTPDNQIEELLSLDKSVYEAIYGKKPSLKIDRAGKIEWFKKFLLSTKPLKKVVLSEQERKVYIKNLELSKEYIERLVEERSDNANTRTLFKSADLISFQDSVNNLKNAEDNGIVLLGNPGSGKSLELTHLAVNEWKKRDKTGWIPFFSEIRTFTQNSSVEDYLPEKWKEIPQLLIIYDGVDEVLNIPDFVSKIEKFNIDLLNSKNKVKFVFSCRTNIYESLINSISNFQVTFLADLSHSEAREYLKNRYDISNEDFLILLKNKKSEEFLTNPYYLKLLGEYYSIRKTLPINKAVLINKFVEKRLEHEKLKKFKLNRYDKSLVKKSCMKVALAMEAMQISEISDSQVLELLKSEKEIFIDSCFIKKVYGRESWKFEHRNLQEYFVAKSIKNLGFDEILSFICIDSDTPKTHPSWLNSISYLLNLIEADSEKYKMLIEWLIKYDPEVLFESDLDRLSSTVRFEVFKNYFNKRCIEEQLWIRSFDSGVIELAKFADTSDSISFLINQLKNKDNHRRARISAGDLLSYMSIQDQEEKIKTLILDLLSAPIEDVDIDFKADLIHQFKRYNFHHSSNFIENIMNALGEIDHPRVISPILLLIEEANPDTYATFIKKHAIKILDDKKRKYPKRSNLLTGEKDHFYRVLMKFEKADNLIFSLKFFLGNQHPYSLLRKIPNFLTIIIEKLILMHDDDNAIYDLMLDFICEKFYFSYSKFEYEEIVLNFFRKTNSTNIASIDLYNRITEFNKKRSFLILLLDKENIENITNKFLEDKVDATEIVYFRNRLSHHNFDLALKFEELIRRKIPEFFPNNLKAIEHQEYAHFHSIKYQHGFNLLFQVKQMKKITLDFFENFKSNKIFTWDDMDYFEEKYWNSLELQHKFPSTFIDVIHDALSKNFNGIGSENVIELLNSDLYILNKIKKEICSSHANSFSINSDQKTKIYNWCVENLPLCDFKSYSFSLDNDNNRRCILVSYFRTFFDFDYPEEYLLKMLLFDVPMESNGKNVGLEYIAESVDKKLLDDRIIYNLNHENLQGSILINHLGYLLDNDLSIAYHHIENYLSDTSNNPYTQRRILKKYINKNRNLKFLKRCIESYEGYPNDTSIYWDWIDLLIENKEIEFATNTLTTFVGNQNNNEDLLVPIKLLIKANYPQSFELYVSWIVRNKKFINKNTLTKKDYAAYSNKVAIYDLLKLFDLANQNFSKYDRAYHPINIAIDSLKNIAKLNGVKECEQILRGLDLIRHKAFEKEEDLFYVNTLKNDIKKELNNHKSKPLSLKEISFKIDGLRGVLI